MNIYVGRFGAAVSFRSHMSCLFHTIIFLPLPFVPCLFGWLQAPQGQPEDLKWAGTLQAYDEDYDRITAKVRYAPFLMRVFFVVSFDSN